VNGKVLISYIPDYVMAAEEDVSPAHTHFWECREMALSYVAEGFAVDVVRFDDKEFIPARDYDVLVSARTDLERLSHHLPARCLKIAHLDTAHFLTHNANASQRLLAIRDRHSVSLRSNRMVEDNWAIESADLGCVLGNDFTADTYRFAGKPIHRIPLSSVRQYDWDNAKDFDACRNTFLWFGSGGFAHKGLDLVIDAFKSMPEKNLIICGPLAQEPRFCRAFNKEMFHTENIETIGWIDVTSDDFTNLTRRSVATIYPSCSEGGGGSVLTCMHAGLIPVVTHEASVDVEDFGLLLEPATIDKIRETVHHLSDAPSTELEKRSRAAWRYARENHTREIFRQYYRRFVRNIVRPELEQRINS
jgi:glycosyltransferase involved in cell wall biosynthesis